MFVAVVLLAVAVTVGVVSWTCERVGWPTPLVLVVVGAVVAAVPGVPHVELQPDIVLIGVLPPLLYAAAVRTSLVDFRANRMSTLVLSVGAVAFGTVAVGLFTWWVVPGAMTLAAGLALGAVVAPPDAVATTAIGRRIGMPRRLTALLEQESLVNDATALAALTTAIAALTRPVGPGEVAWRFGLAAAGGIGVGLLAAAVLGAARRRIDDPVLDTSLSFAAPFVAFLPAQAIRASGVLAVVVTGLLLAHKSPALQSGASRVAEATNWRTIAFLLENAVFLLIGLQLPALLEGVADNGTPALAATGVCLGVLVATILARMVFVFGAAGLFRIGGRPSAWSWQTTTVVGWAGMRGVVTLAAVFVLPPETPQRDLLRLAAFTVVAGTLLLQGLSLPWLVRRLRMRGPDAAEDALAAAGLVDQATRAGLRRLDEIVTGDEPVDVLDALRRRSAIRSNTAWERLGRPESGQATPSGTYRRLRLVMLAAERRTIVAARDAGTAAGDVLRRALVSVDVEESLLDRVDELEDSANREEELVPDAGADDCEHLHAAPRVIRLRTPGECPDCLREGTTWVHLRGCLTCGRVGCCDSSEGRHATAHFHGSSHPVMRSVEPGEAWRWCYVDERIG